VKARWPCVRVAPGPEPGLRYLTAGALAVFALSLILAFLLVFQNAGVMTELINDDFNQQQLLLARQAASHIDADLEDIQVELSTLVDYLGGHAGPVPQYGLTTLFEHTRRKGSIAAGLLDAQGRVLAERHEPDVDRGWLQRQMRTCAGGDAAESRLIVLHTLQQRPDMPVVAGLLCARGGSAAEGRTVAVVLDVPRLVRRATQRVRSGKTGYAWAIDETGTFLSHPDADFIGRNAFEARHEREPYISFNEINRIMQERMLRGEEGVGTYVSGWHRGVAGHIEKLIAFTPVSGESLVPGSMWSVAVVAPTTEVADAVHRVYLRQYTAQGALIAGMFAAGLLVLLQQRRRSHALAREKAIQESFVASILQSSLDAILFVDNDNRVQVWNRGAERIFGYTAEEMVGQTFHRLIPPELVADEEVSRIRAEAQRAGYYRDHRAPRITKDGRRITIDISRTMVLSAEGEPIGSAIILRDVSEVVEWEQRIYHTEKLASIGNLAAGVAHEINNPLAVMLGFTDLLLERFEPGSREHEDLKMIAETGNHARRTVENLLGFARITEGLEDTVDVNRCIDTVMHIVENTLMTAKIELRRDVPDGLPRVRGDAREFQQVLFNLVNNAVAAMRQSGGTLRVEGRSDEHWVQISVTDTGSGIPNAIASRVWDPFFTTKKVGEGTGLGLSLCYGIVTKYGGTISFRSRAAADHPSGPWGTTFDVRMPVCPGEGKMPRSAVEARSPGGEG
jgi:PAS domain S-box-containing protein